MTTATKGVACGFAMLVLGCASAVAGACTGEIDQLTKQLAAADAGTGPTTGHPAPTAGDRKGQHPATSLMNKEAEGKATSPEDVRRQSGIKADASKTLARAREFDAKGNEAACRDTVRTARTQAGL